jgi:phosphinothricin acetyltransferase
MAPLIRNATAADMAAIAAIYATAVLNGTASFELDPPDAAEMTARWQKIAEAGLPYIVAETGGAVAGYAYAGPYRPRPAYRFTLEDSIYIAPDRQGAGIGSALMGALIARAEATGARQLLAVIGDPPNQAASVALHSGFGFERVGLLPAVGWKAGAWRDTLLMQRPLGPGSAAPPG